MVTPLHRQESASNIVKQERALHRHDRQAILSLDHLILMLRSMLVPELLGFTCRSNNLCVSDAKPKSSHDK